MIIGNFNVDENASDEEYLYVDVAGIGTVAIHNTGEGISVDIFPLQVMDEPIASCHAMNDDLIDAKDSRLDDWA